jgi:hypothetical protein
MTMMTKPSRKGVLTAALGLALATSSLAAPAFAGGAKVASQLRQPTAAETRALVAGLQAMMKSSAPSQLKQFADGTMSIDLGTSFLNISVAQVQPDGSIHAVCLDTPEAANALSTAAPAYEEK